MSGNELYRFCRHTWPETVFADRDRKHLLQQALKTLSDATMQQTRMSKAIKKEKMESDKITYDDDDHE